MALTEYRFVMRFVSRRFPPNEPVGLVGSSKGAEPMASGRERVGEYIVYRVQEMQSVEEKGNVKGISRRVSTSPGSLLIVNK
jgi:hypothetical protein